MGAPRRIATAAFAAFLASAGCRGDGRDIELRPVDLGGAPPELPTTGGGPHVPRPECVVDADCERALAPAACRVVRCDDGGVCEVGDAPDGTLCEDGDACTVGDRCDAGRCDGGAARACDDGDACTEDACDPTDGCLHTAKACPGGGAPCAAGVCDPATGACGVAPLADGVACDDGLSCTDGDVCQGGVCVGQVSSACDDGDACTADACSPEGCVHSPASGPCDDGDPCTLDDRCAAGGCEGTPVVCTDDDPCTIDLCVDGSCAFEPVVGCEPPSGGCEGEPLGAPCDDGDPSTVGDLCLADGCAGFSVTRVASADEGRRLTRVGRDGASWTAAVELDGAADGALGMLAEVDLDGAVQWAPETRTPVAIAAIHGAFAVDAAAVLWQHGPAGWGSGGPLAEALASGPPGTPAGLWTYRTAAGDVHLWAVGEGPGGSAWLRWCTLAGGAAQASCANQSLAAVDQPVPRAITGSERCDAVGCWPELVVAADLFASTGPDGVPRYFNDVYDNPGGTNPIWQVAAFDPGPSRTTSRDLAALAPGLYLAVGGYGYLRDNTPLGEWGDQVTVTQDQGDLHFEGAWAGAGGTLVVGWRPAGGQRDLILMAAPQLGDPASPGAWHRHVLATEFGDDVGLFDVWGDDDGDVVLAGAGRLDAGGRVEALLFVRRAVAAP